MELLNLPPEILKEIIDWVGQPFFREDLSRLRVCKQWFEFACLTCFKSITLSQKNLRAFVLPSDSERKCQIESALQTLGLEWTEHTPATLPSLSPQRSGSNEEDDPFVLWQDRMIADLDQLSALIRRSPRLRALRIMTRRSSQAQTPDTIGMGYFPIHTMQALLRTENLRTLVMDLAEDTLTSSPDEDKDGNHLCPRISALLPSLEVLQVRMPRICSALLKYPDTQRTPRIKSVVLNLSLNMVQRGITSARHSKSCCSSPKTLLQLKEDIITEAKALAAQTQTISTLRVLTHRLPNFQTESLDILATKTMKLEHDAAWDDDGIIIDESEPESEFSDEEPLQFEAE